jgi:hypothetical protein
MLRKLSTLILFTFAAAMSAMAYAATYRVASAVVTASPEQHGLDPELVRAITQSPDRRGDGIVFLQAKADLGGASSIKDWQERGKFVLDALQALAKRSQAPLLQLIAAQSKAGEVKEHTPYYVVNAVFVRGGTLKAFRSIARFPGVRYVEKNKLLPLPEPPAFKRDERPQSTIAWGVTKIGADQAWGAFNAKGQGIVVGSIDTGVDSTHPALVHQYRGTATGNNDYNWFDPTGTYPAAPGDNVGHGTHTTGTMVGDDGAGHQIGVAPAAQWIAAKGCVNNGCAQNDLLSAGQWILAPTNLAGNSPNPAMRPRVVNNSWANCTSANTWYQGVVQAWIAADIFPAFAAGNSCSAVGAPGSYPESFASGATDINDVIAGFSAHGPSPLTSLTKPDVTAPGVNVYSSLPGGSYGTDSGTSMASPHTAGCAALVLSKNPSLPTYQLERVLAYTSVDLGASGPDSTYGIGRINCFSAVDWSVKPWWQWQWGSGAGQIGLWNMNNGDQYIAGDFDGDGQDELLAVSTTGWAHLMKFTGSGWQWMWGTGPNGQIGLWNIHAGDKFIAGDFDGSGRDELLAVSTTGWAHVMKFTGSGWQWMWGTGPNGQIGLWNIHVGDKFIAGDFDGSGKAGLLAVSTTGWAHVMKFTGSGWQWLWGTGPNGHIGLWNIGLGDKFIAGDFDGSGKAKLLAFSTNGWSHLMQWTGSGWQWLWGNAGASQIALWNMNPPDLFLAGKFDASNSRDELLAIERPWMHLMKYDY